jgi:4-amino-4-deoxy-L-arabinose transferase-like glycosyltransferase
LTAGTWNTSSKMPRYSSGNLSPALKATGLAILVLLTRLPFRSRFLFDWDSANFAFSLKQFDIATHQPHPPGYPLIVAAARLAHLIFRDANTALVAVSIVASVGTVIFLYLLARAIFNESVALAAALSLIFNPIFWFYGEVAAAYAPEAFAATMTAYLAYRVARKDLSPYWLSLGFALAGGIRPNILLLLSPLYLWALLSARISLWGWLKQAAVFGIVAALWTLPLLKAAGGLTNYLAEGKALSVSTFAITSIAYLGAEGFWTNSWRFGGWLIACCGLLLIPAIIQLVNQRRIFFEPWRPDLNRAFFFAWILPPAFFYWATHIPKAGYLLTFIAALQMVFMAITLQLWGKRGATLAILSGLAFFVLTCPLDVSWSKPITPRYAADFLWLRYSAAALRQNDRAMSSYQQILAEFSPADTALLLDWKRLYREDLDWRVASYYFSDYPVYCLAFDPEVRPAFLFAWRGCTPVPLTNALHTTPVPVDKSVKRVVLLSSQMEKITDEEGSFAGGRERWLMGPMPDKTLQFAGYEFVKSEINPLQLLYRQSAYATSIKSYWREPKPKAAAVSTCK